MCKQKGLLFFLQEIPDGLESSEQQFKGGKWRNQRIVTEEKLGIPFDRSWASEKTSSSSFFFFLIRDV